MSKTPRGFTIVELLIVIVVIAILAAIGIVAYGGVQNRAHDSAVQGDLRQFGQQITLYHAEHGYYPIPDTTSMADLRASFSRGSYHEDHWFTGANNLFYCHNDSGRDNNVALVARAASGRAWQWNGSISEYTGPTGGSTIPICAAAGAPISGTGTGSRTLIIANGNWAGWVQ